MIAGIGIGLVFNSPLIAIQSMVSQENMATATGTFGFVRIIATSLSIVMGGAVFQNTMQSQESRLREILPTDVADKLSGSSAAANVMLIRTLNSSE